MKKILLFLSACLMMQLVQAQNPIPNPGFELWTGTEPDGWTTTNVPPDLPVMPFSPSHTGSWALKGEVVSIGPSAQIAPMVVSNVGGTGFPVTQVYPSMTFWYLAFFQSGDELEADVLFLDSTGTIMAAGSVTYSSSVAGWTQATVPVINSGGVPATCAIVFSLINPNGGQSTTGSYFVVDDLDFPGASGLTENHSAAAGIQLSPNPVQDRLRILGPSPGLTGGPGIIHVYDPAGRLLMTETKTAKSFSGSSLDVSRLMKGYYLLEVQQGNERFRTSFIKQ